jgi:hypothetical protein
MVGFVNGWEVEAGAHVEVKAIYSHTNIGDQLPDRDSEFGDAGRQGWVHTVVLAVWTLLSIELHASVCACKCIGF